APPRPSGRGPPPCAPCQEYDVRTSRATRAARARSEVETGETVAAEDQRDLASVVEVVLDQVPHDPLPGEHLRPRTSSPGELDGQIVRRPTPEAVLDHRPRPLETLDDLGGPPWVVLVVLPGGVLDRQAGDGRARDAEQVAERGLALAQDVVEPIGPGRGHVAGQLPDGPEPRGRPQAELVGA